MSAAGRRALPLPLALTVTEIDVRCSSAQESELTLAPPLAFTVRRRTSTQESGRTLAPPVAFAVDRLDARRGKRGDLGARGMADASLPR